MLEKENKPSSDVERELMVDAPSAAAAIAMEESGESHHHFVGVEEESVNAGLVIGIVLGVVVIVTGLVVFAFTITEVTTRDTMESILADIEYPDLRETRAASAALLNKYETVNAEEGSFRIPIDRAIDLMVNENFQSQADGNFSDELKLLPSY